ncbi:MAG: hypothetical protein OQK51_14945 [Kangiellaceae bacterium]|nr:hypothetical protein [Kangiellaceae bacterium]
MDYSKFDYDQLVEALNTMDKEAYPENYKTLVYELNNYSAERRKKQEIENKTKSLSIGQLKQKLSATDDPVLIELLNQKITCKLWLRKKRLIWWKWLSPGIIALIAGIAVPGSLKQVILPIGLVAFIGCFVMAYRASRNYQKSDPAPQFTS